MPIVNITTENDADFIRGFVYIYTPSGTPVDLTGNTLRMGVRAHATDIEEDLLLTTENGAFVITNPVGGQFTMTILQEQLVRLQIRTFDQSLVRITPSGSTRRIWSGTLTNNAGPSR